MSLLSMSQDYVTVVKGVTWHSYRWVLLHIWMNHVTRVEESHIWRIRVAHIIAFCHCCEMSHATLMKMMPAAHMNGLCHYRTTRHVTRFKKNVVCCSVLQCATVCCSESRDSLYDSDIRTCMSASCCTYETHHVTRVKESHCSPPSPVAKNESWCTELHMWMRFTREQALLVNVLCMWTRCTCERAVHVNELSYPHVHKITNNCVCSN